MNILSLGMHFTISVSTPVTHIAVLLPGALAGLVVDLAVEHGGLTRVDLCVLRLLFERLKTASRWNERDERQTTRRG